MKRIFLLPFLFLAVAPLVDAGDSRPGEAQARVGQFQQNRTLMTAAVGVGLTLAAAPDPLDRAQDCAALAKVLAGEVATAAQDQERARVIELGQYLGAVFEQGVAANWKLARKQIPAGAGREKTLDAILGQMDRLLPPLEKILGTMSSSDTDELGLLRKTWRETRSSLDNAALP